MKAGGFTLIELMMVIMIIAILAGISIPVYQDYTVRARITAGIHLALSAKNSVSTTIHSGIPLANITLANSGYQPASSDNVQQITVLNGGNIQITYTALAKNIVITLIPIQGNTTDLQWNCQVSNATNNRFVPANCRI